MQLKDLARQLVDPERCRSALKHSIDRVIERAHVEARGLIKHVGVGREFGFQARGDWQRVGNAIL